MMKHTKMMKHTNWCFGILFSGAIATGNAHADHPNFAFGSDLAGPLQTISAESMPAGTWGFGSRVTVVENSGLSDARLAAFAQAGVDDVHRVDSIVSVAASLAYGVTDALDVSVRIPWVERNDIREGEFEHGEAEAHAHGDTRRPWRCGVPRKLSGLCPRSYAARAAGWRKRLLPAQPTNVTAARVWKPNSSPVPVLGTGYSGSPRAAVLAA